MNIKIVLADDHKIVRDGLRSLIEQESDMEIVAEVEDGREAIKAIGETSPDVVIMDVAMPNLNGVDATRRITSEYPSVKVIALSMHSDKRFVAEMLKAGSRGYLVKDCAFEELVRAIRTTATGATYLSPSITGVIMGDYVRQLSGEQTYKSDVLSPREREVLQLIAEGNTTKEVASCLHVSVKTIETHRQHIMKKLHLRSIAELTKYAIREGLTAL